MFDLSIVLPHVTCARTLERTLAAIVAGTRCDFEVMVAEPAPFHEMSVVVEDAQAVLGDRLSLLSSEASRPVALIGSAMSRSLARNVVILPEGGCPLPGSLDRAVDLIDSADAGIACLAIFHRAAAPWHAAYQINVRGQSYHLPHMRGTLCATIPIARRETLRAVATLDERFAVLSALHDLSLQAWNAGLRVLPAFGCAVNTTTASCALSESDHRALLEKWDLPAQNLNTNEFDPVWPCTVRGLKSTALAA